jgi:transposase
MVLRPELRVSVDVGCHRHSVAVGLSTGELLEEFEVEHRPEGFADFFSRIERHQRRYPGPVVVAMEGYSGHARPLDTVVRERQWRLFNVNNLKLARFKQVFPAAAKTDRIDARSALELMQLGEHLPWAREALQEVQGAPAENLELKRLTRRRRALVDEKSRVLCRMQDDLHAVCPGLLEITTGSSGDSLLNYASGSEARIS